MVVQVDGHRFLFSLRLYLYVSHRFYFGHYRKNKKGKITACSPYSLRYGDASNPIFTGIDGYAILIYAQHLMKVGFGHSLTVRWIDLIK